jgi:hypothetical protein
VNRKLATRTLRRRRAHRSGENRYTVLSCTGPLRRTAKTVFYRDMISRYDMASPCEGGQTFAMASASERVVRPSRMSVMGHAGRWGQPELPVSTQSGDSIYRCYAPQADICLILLSLTNCLIPVDTGDRSLNIVMCSLGAVLWGIPQIALVRASKFGFAPSRLRPVRPIEIEEHETGALSMRSMPATGSLAFRNLVLIWLSGYSRRFGESGPRIVFFGVRCARSSLRTRNTISSKCRKAQAKICPSAGGYCRQGASS